MINSKGKTNSFSIDHRSEIDEFHYQGSFTSRKMSILDQTRISKRKSEICGGMFTVRDDAGNPTGQGIDEWTEVQGRMIAILEVALVQKPEWWDLGVIGDEDLIGKVFEEVMLFENSFRGRGRAQAQGQDGSGGGQGNGQEQHAPSIDDNNAPKVVDKQVSAALDA